MATRYIGDARVVLRYDDRTAAYVGAVYAGRYAWRFDELRNPPAYRGAVDSAEAYDKAAASAVSFGANYTTGNRGDAPDWAPSAAVADAIDAAAWAQDDRGAYEVRRSKLGRGRYV
jgi:hypothetical protein